MVKMNEDILNVINAVLDYKKFIISNNYVVPKENFDWFMETESYYHSLSLPNGMKKNRSDFEKILGYDKTEILHKLNNTNYSDLHHEIWKI